MSLKQVKDDHFVILSTLNTIIKSISQPKNKLRKNLLKSNKINIVTSLENSNQLDMTKMSTLQIKLLMNFHDRDLTNEESEFAIKEFKSALIQQSPLDKYPESTYRLIFKQAISKKYSSNVHMLKSMLTR